TVSPTIVSELLRTAVTLGESARANCATAIEASPTSKIRRGIDISINHQLSTINSSASPVVIDMTFYFAFIKSDSRLFVFHRFQQGQRLPFAHLAFFLLFRFHRLLCFVGGFLRGIACSALHFSREFLFRRLRRGGGCVFIFSFSR